MQCFYENELFKNKSRRQIKSFSVQQFFKNAAEVWASSPHLRSKSRLYNNIKQKSKKQSKESQLPSKSEGCNERYGFRGNCDSQASWGCAPALPNRFRVVFLRAMFHMKQSEIHCNCSPGTVAKLLLTASGKQGGLVRPTSKSCRFSHHPLRVPRAWHRDFAACGQRSGLLALNLASIFEKLLEQKTFCLPAARFFRLFPKNTTPFPRNSTKKFDSRKKICYNKNGCRSMTVAVNFFMEIHCGGDRLSPASFHNDLWIMEKESGNERCSNTGIIRKDWIFL